MGPFTHFLDHIVKHYLRESQQGFGSALFGGILLIGALLFFRFAPALSFGRGLMLPFLVIGLIMGLGGFADGYGARRAMSRKAELYNRDPHAFFSQEVPQVERTHKGWKRIRIIWGAISLLGVVLLITVRKQYWLGVALGTLILSIAGHIEEAISKNFNERYYQEVLSMDANKANP